jgi:urease accessory protein
MNEMILADAAETRSDLNALTAQHQRVDGSARIGFKASPGGGTVLGDLYQRAPCRVLFPDAEAGDLIQAVVLTTSGGLTGGDRTRVEVAVGAGARATVTTQAAEKIYRALPDTADALIEVDIAVGQGAWSEWLAQETILFDRARLRRAFVARLAPDSRLLAVDSVVFGRTAMGETFERGTLHDSWRISRGGRLVWADALHLEGDVRAIRSEPFGFGTAVACSTMVYAGPDAGRYLGDVRRVLEQFVPAGGATAFDGLLVIRLLSDNAAALRQTVVALGATIRHAAADLPMRMPRVWYC